MPKRELILVGPTGNTHVVSSLLRAAKDLGINAAAIDTAPAYSGPAILKKVAWHMLGRKPVRLGEFSRRVLKEMMDNAPVTIVTVGQAPVRGETLMRLRSQGIKCINFSTDDPFNPAVRAPWHLEDLVAYDTVYTPRRSNLEELKRHGCNDVQYLRFAFDDGVLHDPPENALEGITDKRSVLFVGGADEDRINFFSEFAECGPPLTLVGGYWDRHRIPNAQSLGLRSAEEVAQMTIGAVNICLVRRANRDGHVMRTFEIAAVGGFMLAEDTEDHRELFGPEGQCVLYFKTASEAAEKAHRALQDVQERCGMARALKKLIRNNGHTYRDRLATILGLRG